MTQKNHQHCFVHLSDKQYKEWKEYIPVTPDGPSATVIDRESRKYSDGLMHLEVTLVDEFGAAWVKFLLHDGNNKVESKVLQRNRMDELVIMENDIDSFSAQIVPYID